MSPGPRKKKRLRRKSEELDNHDASNSSESHSLPAQNIPSSLPAVSKINADVPEPVETKTDILRHKQPDDIPQVPIIKEKIETHTELMLEPKSEYVEEMNEDSIEDLTLDDDDLSNMEQMDDQAGPSHGNAGEGSSQGFGGWHMGNQSQDEVFLAAQEAVGAHRDSQDNRVFQYDPLLAVSRVENEEGQTICTYPVISAVDSLATKEIKKEIQERPRRLRRKPLSKTSHRELVTKLRHKYVTEKHQNILICEKKGKLIATLRCVLCNSFVKKGEQFCSRCKEYLETGKKPPLQRRPKVQLTPSVKRIRNKCKKCCVFIKDNIDFCKTCEIARKEIKKEPKLSGKVKTVGKGVHKQILKKPVDKKRPTVSIIKKSRIITKKVVRKRKNFRCESCDSVFVHNKGEMCQKCTKRFGDEAAKTVNKARKNEPKKEENTTTAESDETTMRSLNNIENVEIVEEDDDIAVKKSVFQIPFVDVNDDDGTRDSDYYVSIDDINSMLEDD